MGLYLALISLSLSLSLLPYLSASTSFCSSPQHSIKLSSLYTNLLHVRSMYRISLLPLSVTHSYSIDVTYTCTIAIPAGRAASFLSVAGNRCSITPSVLMSSVVRVGMMLEDAMRERREREREREEGGEITLTACTCMIKFL